MGNARRKQVRAENGRMGSLHAMLAKCPDERSCERRIIEVRWPEGWVCPKCGNVHCSPVASRNGIWQCTRCSRHLSVTAGTCTQGSKVHLRRWFHAMWLVARSKRGVSATELAAQIGVSEITAGLVPERLRAPWPDRSASDVLSGDVEADDLYLGSRDRTKRHGVGRGTDGQPMVCAVERGREERGRCAIRVVPDCSGKAHKTFAEGHVDRSAHVRADGRGGIKGGLKGWPGLDQRKFDASDEEARLPTVRRVISNFESWALGTFHGLSLTRLQSFADEFSWRYSHRGGDATSELLADCCGGYYSRDQLKREVFLPQPLPPDPPKRPRGRPRKHPILQL